MCDPFKEGHHHAKRHATCTKDKLKKMIIEIRAKVFRNERTSRERVQKGARMAEGKRIQERQKPGATEVKGGVKRGHQT